MMQESTISTRGIDMDHRFEFRAVGDSGAIYIGTFGIFMLCFIGSAIALTLPTVILSSWVDLPADTLATVVTIGCSMIALVCAIFWVRYHWKVPRERKIVVDENGVTYFRFRNPTRCMPWDDILRVTEETSEGEGVSYSLRYKLRRGSFRVSDGDYLHYGLLKLLTVGRLPDRTTLVVGPNLAGADLRAVATALRDWGFPGHAAALPSANTRNV
jgi:hypothetical protein